MSEPIPTTHRWRLLLRLLMVFAAAALAVGAVWALNAVRTEATLEVDRERPIRAPMRVAVENDQIVVTLDAETRRRNGIETAVLAPAPYQERVRAYGTVFDLARLTDLSNGYQNAKAALQMAEAKLAASRPAMERAQTLNKNDRIVSQATVQAAQANFGADLAGLATAQSQVRTLAATAQQEWGSVLGKALIEGAPAITRLIERKDFLLQITLPPGSMIAAPPPTATVATVNGQTADIAFVSAATRTDPQIQGVSYFYVAKVDSGVLPGMSVLAYLPMAGAANGLTIPASAIVWWQDRAWVYRVLAEGKFSRVAIATDNPGPGGAYIARSFGANAEIVTQGAQMLLSEEFRAQIQVGEDAR